MLKLKLSNMNEYFLIDNEDLYKVEIHRWRFHGRRVCTGNCNKQGTRLISLARHLLNVTDTNLVVDHINGNPLDNRKCNLRISTKKQNARNRGKSNGSYSSEFLGVCWNQNDRKWMASIRVDYKLYYLGSFDSEIEAASARDEASKRYFQEFGVLNLS